MARSFDLCYMTSTTYTEPTFTTASVTGQNDFQDFFAQDETFVASFKDGSDNYMVAVCSLNGSNQVVADQVLMSSAGATDLTVPTFSGTVDIVIGATSYNTYQQRIANCQSNDTSQKGHVVMGNHTPYSTGNADMTNDQLWLMPFSLDMSAWYYGFFIVHKTGGAGAGDYYLGIYDINESGHPDQLIASTASVAHSGGASESEDAFDTALTITDITQNAGGGVLSYTGADPANGDRVYITGVAGMTEVNQTSFLVSAVDTGADEFTLQDMEGNNVDTSAYTAYSSGGVLHFPKKIAAGDYILGMVTDTNSLRFNGINVADELSRPTMFGVRTGAAAVTRLQKSYTFAALPDAPDMTSGWSDDLGSFPNIGLMVVEG